MILRPPPSLGDSLRFGMRFVLCRALDSCIKLHLHLVLLGNTSATDRASTSLARRLTCILDAVCVVRLIHASNLHLRRHETRGVRRPISSPRSVTCIGMRFVCRAAIHTSFHASTPPPERGTGVVAASATARTTSIHLLTHCCFEVRLCRCPSIHW
jgi:hypothetical protein